MKDRRSSSTSDNPRSTAAGLLAFPEARRNGIRRPVTRSERIFNAVSVVVLILFASGWSWSIANARSASNGAANGATPATAAIANGLTDGSAPTAAYVTGAILDALMPLTGESGKLKASIRPQGGAILPDKLPPGAAATFSNGAVAESATSLRAPARVGIWKLAISAANAIKPLAGFSVITLRPASEEQGGRLGLYFLGSWPAAKQVKPGVVYRPPGGFIEVTQQNQDTQLSEHFKLRDFLPHDQMNVWPKYIAIDMKLIDKDELILTDLQQHGVDVSGVTVMSGFRTPQYNAGGGDPRGRAALSRHMYGDANDIFIDSDKNGQMDDLNHDGRVNIADARVIQDAVTRVERAHPSLVGGCGVYSGTSAHGPFTHIDTRGYPARWIGTGDS
ncbi:MAG: hypothetical protein M3Z17_11810 [Gemmatimonadota bacterium]|nr:hypothetical protein [Gemmatimonadota bacterium]